MYGGLCGRLRYFAPRAKVYAPYYGKPKDEGWWLVLGDTATNQLLSIKRVSVGKAATAKLDFEVRAGQQRLDPESDIRDSKLEARDV